MLKQVVTLIIGFFLNDNYSRGDPDGLFREKQGTRCSQVS